MEVELTWSWAFRIWWGAVWRWFLVSIVATIAVAVVCVVIDRMTGQRGTIRLPAVTITTAILWAIASPWALRGALRAKYGNFRAIIATALPSAPPAVVRGA